MPKSVDDLSWVRGRLEIMELVSSYCFAADNRDADALTALFAEDGRLVFPGRTPAQQTREAVGREAIAAWMRTAWATMEKSIHSIHGHTVRLSSPESASGVVALSSKIAAGSSLLHAATRYVDDYVRIDGSWLFRSRTQYTWFTAATEPASDPVAAAFVGPRGEPAGPGLLPEAIPSWRRFRDGLRSGGAERTP
jgi:uncharacterized protein (TIGR02246 family)